MISKERFVELREQICCCIQFIETTVVKRKLNCSETGRMLDYLVELNQELEPDDQTRLWLACYSILVEQVITERTAKAK